MYTVHLSKKSQYAEARVLAKQKRLQAFIAVRQNQNVCMRYLKPTSINQSIN